VASVTSIDMGALALLVVPTGSVGPNLPAAIPSPTGAPGPQGEVG
jgi:hypothetical protein